LPKPIINPNAQTATATTHKNGSLYLFPLAAPLPEQPSPAVAAQVVVSPEDKPISGCVPANSYN